MLQHRIRAFRLFQSLMGFVICVSFLNIFLPANGAENSPASETANAAPKEQVLFPFDDEAIPFNKGLLLTLAHAKKSLEKPVLPSGNPGDPDYPKAQYYGTVLHIGQEYRMWYSGVSESNRVICYATSTNGIAWEKPKLGLGDFNGSKQNNIVILDGTNLMEGATALVLYEPDDANPEHLYKMLREISPSEIAAAYSADGLRWKTAPGSAPDVGVIRGSTIEPCGILKFNGCYFVSGQGGTIPNPLKGAAKRMCVTYISYDFEHWSEASHLCLRRDPVPPRPPKDFEFHRGEQVHMGASLWNRGNVVLGIYGQYHNETNDRRTSTIDLGLIVSRDGLHFNEPIPDFKFIESYEEVDGADARLLQGEGFENIGEKTIYWYSIWASTPGSPSGVRIATWGRDRFGYFSPGPYEKAHCVSSPLNLHADHGEVYINADQLSAQCQMRVELLNEQMVPLPAYSGDNCIPIKKSGLRQKVAWKSGDRVENVSGPIRIKVSWEGDKSETGRLYAIYLQ